MYSYKTPAAPARQEDSYTELAKAIVLQAVHDYRSTLNLNRKNPNNRKALPEAMEYERFFRSGWYMLLTNLDGDLLIDKLREETRSK